MLEAVLLMLLVGAAQAPAVPAGPIPTHVDATALAREGHYEGALDAFRRIAAANPRDHEARLGIARVHGLMGNHDQAEAVYRSVLLEDPGNVEAMRGTGAALVALGRTDEGIDLLRRAENAQPQNPDVLADLSDAHGRAGNSNLAVLYAERVVNLSATETHRQALEQARLAHAHRVEISSFGEQYSTAAPDTGSLDARINYRWRENLRLIGRGQHQRKFGFSEQRGGGGVEWRWRPDTTLSGQVLAGPSENQVLPRLDVNAEVTHAARSTEWVAGYRFFDFPSAQLSVISPGVTWVPTSRTSLSARYFLSVTEFPTLRGRQQDHSVALRGARRVRPRLWMNAGYAYGTENFDTLSPDRVGNFRAHTGSAGVRYDLPRLTSLTGTYELQSRPDDVTMGRFSIGLTQRF